MTLRNTSLELSPDGTKLTIVSLDGQVLFSLPIIAAKPEHRNFILSTWVKSYENQARKQGIPRDMYAKHEPEIAESRWQDCWVATDDEGYTVLAWVCGSEGNLWHVYVIPTLRKMRLATRMIEFATGGLKAYAKPWPYSAHARLNPYLQRAK